MALLATSSERASPEAALLPHARAHYTHTRSQATCLSHALEEEQRDRHGIQGLPARISHRKSQGFRTRDWNCRKLFRVIYNTRAVNRISENCMEIWKTRFPDFQTFIVSDFQTFIVSDFQTFIVPDFPTFIWPSFQICKPSNLLSAFRLLNLRTFRLSSIQISKFPVLEVSCIFKLPNF